MAIATLKTEPRVEEPTVNLGEALERQQRAFRKDPMPSAKIRIERMQALKQLLVDNEQAFIDALEADYSARSPVETQLAELIASVQQVNYLCGRVKRWMKPQKRHVPIHLQPASAFVHYQPLGVVGVMVPFNYPILLACAPLATALAAGNRVMVKMPENTPATSALFAKLIEEVYPADLVTVVNGEVEVSSAFSQLPFDHLLFTGATSVGKHVMRAAAENLTPVTLELGGKSPVIVGEEADIQHTADVICFGKSMNAGQTCVAPDYILLPEGKIDAFKAAYKKAFNKFYPKLSDNSDATAIVNERHQQRLYNWLADAQSKGATVEPMSDEVITDGSRRMLPQLITDVSDNMLVMQEELFGPLLPLVPYKTMDDAIRYINDRPRPLALYYFGTDKQHQQRMLDETHSGGVAFNETMLQVAIDDMPFGGIGPSGMGQYHGHEGFLTFSKAKGVLRKGRFNGMKFLYPPYKTKIMRLLANWLMR